MMKTFFRLYFKDYVAKALSCFGFLFLAILKGVLNLYSLVHGILVYPVVLLSLICIGITVTADVINFGMLFGFVLLGLFAAAYRYLEPYLYHVVCSAAENFKYRLQRPVYLKSRVKFTM